MFIYLKVSVLLPMKISSLCNLCIVMLGNIAVEGLRAQKLTYVIAGMTTGDGSTWPARYKPTFETYLNSEVGTKFTPPINFVLKAVDSVDIFTLAGSGMADFVYPTSGIFSCLDSEFGLMPLATIRRSYVIDDQQYLLNKYGGVMVVRANNSEILDVEDMKGRIIVSSNFLQSQFQWNVLTENGFNFLQDPAQIRFLPNDADQIQAVWDVLSGKADVGFACDTVLNDPTLRDHLGSLRVVNLMEHLQTDQGQPWPFLVRSFTRTPLSPKVSRHSAQ